MKKAWIENSKIRDVAPGDPATLYHPDIAILYDTDVPDGAKNGDSFVDGVWTAAPEPEPATAPIDPCQWLIDTGAFYDRFGAAKMAVLTSQDVGVKAIITDVAIRKWIDLQRADVAQSLAYIGSVVPSVDATLQASILTTPVSAVENLALRKLYF